MPIKKPRENVERALTEWGRFTVVPDGNEADLVIGIRTGDDKLVRPTIKGGPFEDNMHLGQRSQGPPLGGEQGPDPDSRSPRISNEVGAIADSFAVYKGHVAHRLNSSALWHYMAKDCLLGPKITAVEEFRKAVAEAAKSKVANTP